MAEGMLSKLRIFVAEDEYLLADDIRETLEGAGAVVLGPFATVDQAQTMIGTGEEIDVALLDINLQGEMVFSIADRLRERDIPVIFTTGYDQWAIPDRFADTPRIEKPIDAARVTRAIGRLVIIG